jgi:hypothetical protein
MNLYEALHAADDLDRFAALQLGRHVKASHRLIHPHAILIGRTLHRCAFTRHRRGRHARPRVNDDEKTKNSKEPFACAVHSSSPVIESPLLPAGGACKKWRHRAIPAIIKSRYQGWMDTISLRFRRESEQLDESPRKVQGRAFTFRAYPSPQILLLPRRNLA